MSKRINIVLPEATVKTIDRLAKPGQRSHFIDQAVQHFLAHRSTEALRTRLEVTALRDQDVDREIAADWFAVDKETWQQLEDKQPKKQSSSSAAKSTSRRSIRP